MQTNTVKLDKYSIIKLIRRKNRRIVDRLLYQEPRVYLNFDYQISLFYNIPIKEKLAIIKRSKKINPRVLYSIFQSAKQYPELVNYILDNKKHKLNYYSFYFLTTNGTKKMKEKLFNRYGEETVRNILIEQNTRKLY